MSFARRQWEVIANVGIYSLRELYLTFWGKMVLLLGGDEPLHAWVQVSGSNGQMRRREGISTIVIII